MRELKESPYINSFMIKPVRSNTLKHTIQRSLNRETDIAEQGSTLDNNNITFQGSILLVEDTKENQIIALAMLSNLGLNVQLAENGLEAIQIISDKCFDLVFMDCLMPELDGYQTTRLIRSRQTDSDKRVPIIALTANAFDSAKEKCLASGMDDFISKPYDEADIIKVLQEYLSPNSYITVKNKVTQTEGDNDNALIENRDRINKLIDSLGHERFLIFSQ